MCLHGLKKQELDGQFPWGGFSVFTISEEALEHSGLQNVLSFLCLDGVTWINCSTLGVQAFLLVKQGW